MKIRDRLFFYKLKDAARTMERLYDNALMVSGITIMQLAILDDIAHSPNDNPTLRSSRMYLDRSTLSRCMRVLVKSGHLELFEQKRTVKMGHRLTKKGKKVLEISTEVCDKYAKDLFERALIFVKCSIDFKRMDIELGEIRDTLAKEFNDKHRNGR